MKVATHSGTFHADDVFALATLKLAGVVTNLVRTRDAQELAKCDLRVDVGHKYNPDTGDFDHHQAGGAGERANGIPYASFGLIWKQYGRSVAGSEEAAQRIDERLVQQLDAEDAGYIIFASSPSGIRPYNICTLITNLNPSWKTQPTPVQMDKFFDKAVAFATWVLELEIKAVQEQLEARASVRKAIETAQDPRAIILDKHMPWREIVGSEAPQALYVVYPVWPAVRNQWVVQAVSKGLDSFESRQSLPAAWRGKRDADLATASGVKDAVFCHATGFLAVTESKEGTLKLVELALQQP